MQRKISPSLNDQNKTNIKSSFISQYSPEHKQKVANLTSHKHLSSSTFLDLEDSKNKLATRKLFRKETEYHPLAEQLTRARSLKNIEDNKFKSAHIIPQAQQIGTLNENTLKLKAEELLFKLKVKFCTLLQQISISESDLNKFNKIHKIDEIILFLSERIKEKLNRSQSASSSNKDKELLEQRQSEIESLKGKLSEKENIEKTYKSKLKQTHAQLKSMYDKVNVKEKEFSSKITEIYQLKTQMKEQDKIIEGLKLKVATIEKEKLELKNNTNNKDQADLYKSLNDEKNILQQEFNETKEELETSRQKVVKLQELNSHLNEQLTRWRERFQFQAESKQSKSSSDNQPQTPNDILMVLPNQLKKSTMSMNSAYISNFNNSVRIQSLTSLQIQNTKLKIQIKQYQKQNEQLKRNLLNYSSFKEKYEQTLQTLSQKQIDYSKGMDSKRLDCLKQRSGQLYRTQIEGHYKRKTEQVAREWKDKLYQVVCKYQDQIELLKNQISDLTHQKEISQKKIYSLANQKYDVQTKLIEYEKELYSLSRKSNKSIVSLMHCEEHQSEEKQSELKSQSKSSEELISGGGSHLVLKPIQQEESPVKHESGSESNSVFNYYKESLQYKS